ncbi:MAG: citrate/2-methylcitrate synthase [Desulfomonilia bacterium]
MLYCGYDVCDLTEGIYREGRFGFDEVSYLLLTGELPAAEDLTRFSSTPCQKKNAHQARARHTHAGWRKRESNVCPALSGLPSEPVRQQPGVNRP